MLKSNPDPANAHGSSKEKVFPQRTEGEASALLIFFIQNPKGFQDRLSWATEVTTFVHAKVITSMMRKGKSKEKIKK